MKLRKIPKKVETTSQKGLFKPIENKRTASLLEVKNSFENTQNQCFHEEISVKKDNFSQGQKC